MSLQFPICPIENFSKVHSIQPEEVIMNAMKEQSSGGQQVVKSVEDIAVAANRVKDGSNQMLKNSQEILSEMETLTSISNAITNNTLNIANGIEGFEYKVSDVGKLAYDTKNQVEELKIELSKFKV